jgi:hypothetical protein
MSSFPPDIKSTIQKLSPQELEFFKEAKKLDPKFVNLFDATPVQYPAVFRKLISPAETSAAATKLKTELPPITAAMESLSKSGLTFFNPKTPNNFISSLKIANMANDIDVKMGDKTNASENSQKTFGEFAKYKQMIECVTYASFDYTGNVSYTAETIIKPYNESMTQGTIGDYYYSLNAQIAVVNSALASFVPMREQVEEFASLSSLKSFFNNPIANAILSGDISKGIPAIASAGMLKLLQLPPKF